LIELDGEEIAAETGAVVLRSGQHSFPGGAAIDSRAIQAGDIFFGLAGERADGGAFAAAALDAGAWGVVVETRHAAGLDTTQGWVLTVADPLDALQRLASAWRRRIDASVVGVTGSTGKTSTKDILRALLPWRVHASPANYNTEIGLPLALLGAAPDANVIVLEMAMRGRGQIAELARIASPDVGVITNVGPVHLELLGTIEAIAAAKAEILAGLEDSGTAVLPADADALEPHLGESLRVVSFGPGGDVFARTAEVEGGRTTAEVVTPEGEATFEFPFSEAHNLRNALAAVAAGTVLGARPEAMAERAGDIRISELRGERVTLPRDILVINDSYNANPLSMRAALDHLATLDGRKVAVMGEMAELGPDGPGYHRELGAHARAVGVDLVVGVGDLALDYAPDTHVPDVEGAIETVPQALQPGDRVLVKGSRSVGLEQLTEALREAGDVKGSS
jgi:UDP-N-acetylmuramoyl-tripeptide--D-alanyl-D-alanine ligase